MPISNWIETGNGEAIRWTKRGNRSEPVQIQYLVPEFPLNVNEEETLQLVGSHR
jgi:hypothetical protein